MAAPGLAPLRRSFGFEELAAQAAGIDATVVVQTVPEPAETQELLALAAEHELIAGVVGWVDLTAPDVGGRPGRRAPGRDPPPGPGRARPRVAVPRRRAARACARWPTRASSTTCSRSRCSCRRRSTPCARSTTSSSSSTTSPSRRSPSGELEPWATDVRALAAARERGLQALGHGHRGRLGGLERRRSAAVRRDGARGLRARSG